MTKKWNGIWNGMSLGMNQNWNNLSSHGILFTFSNLSRQGEGGGGHNSGKWTDVVYG